MVKNGERGFTILVEDSNHESVLTYGHRLLTFEECLHEIEILWNELYLGGKLDIFGDGIACDLRNPNDLRVECHPEMKGDQSYYYTYIFGFEVTRDSGLRFFQKYADVDLIPADEKKAINELSLRLTNEKTFGIGALQQSGRIH